MVIMVIILHTTHENLKTLNYDMKRLLLDYTVSALLPRALDYIQVKNTLHLPEAMQGSAF